MGRRMSAPRPLFSVIVPTFGRPRFLEEAIGSVLDQTIGDLECLVVDDASPSPVDPPTDDRVRLIRREINGGPAAARNTGLAAARGTYIAFLDDDDMFTPDRLEIAAEGLDRAPVAICWSRTMGSTDPGGGRDLRGDIQDRILDSTTPHLGATAVRRDVVERFDERFVATQDVEWWLRTAARSTVWTVPRVGLVYRRHEGTRNRNGTRARIDASLRLLEEHRDYFASHRRAAAFRWMRIGMMAKEIGDHGLARQAMWRSWRAHPSVRPIWHAARPPATGARRIPAHSGAAVTMDREG